LFEVDRDRVVIGRDTEGRGIDLFDAQASREHAEVARVPGYAAYELRDLDSKNGVYLDGHRVKTKVLEPGAVIRIGQSLLVYSEVLATPPFDADHFVEAGGSLARARAELFADLAAPGDLPVLLLGPTGSGKELMAERIHRKSGRSGPFVPVNCATLNRELLGSELFGHVEGAFSGARGDRAGAFRSAERGTLFLDEIADLSLDQQPALLRALQEERVRPVGADREVPIDARVLAATNQDLEALADSGAFRSDLYARIAGVVVEIPGLAARREEILDLFYELLGRDEPRLSLEAAEALLSYGWPRNVRELQHVAANIDLFSSMISEIDVGLLPRAIQRASCLESSPVPARPAAVRREDLEGHLEKTRGNVAEVARALGLTRQQVYRLLEEHGLTASQFRR
jgi:DNA-binding NtrC family response regulator